MSTEFRTSEQINELAAALAKAQGAMEPAKKTAKNPYFKSNYADLAAVWEVIRKPFADNGLSLVQAPFADDVGKVTVLTRIMHSSGQFIEGPGLSASAKDLGPQAIGSVITYLKRYDAQGMAGVAAEDDDGEAAEHPVQPAREATPARPPAQNWKKPTPAPAMRPNPQAQFTEAGRSIVATQADPSLPIVCDHGVAAPNKCLECADHEKS